MADLQAQRTLVKSPPELWAELSNPESLGRRLSDFGEIRITRLIPEKAVAWEGERASGTVELESSGWGTKVRLTASAPEHDDAPTKPHATLAAADRITAVIEDDEPPSPGAAARSAERVARRAAAAAAVLPPTSEPTTLEPASTSPHTSDPPEPTMSPPAGDQSPTSDQIEPAAPTPAAPPVAAPAAPADQVVATPTPAATATPAPPARRGFFARLFGRRKAARAAAPVRPPTESSKPAAASAAPATPAPSAESLRPAEPAPAAPPAAAAGPAPAGRAPGLTPPRGPQTAEPKQRYAPTVKRPRPLDPEQTLAVLSGVLDDLGAAHHRPFSRE